jgi:hypothetical protein
MPPMGQELMSTLKYPHCTAKPCVKKIKKIENIKIKIKTALPPYFLRMRRMIN